MTYSAYWHEQELDSLVDLHLKYCKSKYAEKWVELTLTHSMFVDQIASMLIDSLEQKGISVDRDFVHKAILLHDIGVYQCYDSELNPDSSLPKYIAHGQKGSKIILDELGDSSLARVALTHTGFGGISIEEIRENKLPIEEVDMTQVTLEEELISWSDKFHTKWPKFYTLEEIESDAHKFGDAKYHVYTYFKRKFGVPDISGLVDGSSIWQEEFDQFIESLSVKQ